MKKFYRRIRLTKISKLFLLIAGLIIIISCDKEDDLTPIEQLPPATQTGAQTFGCLINGEAFVPPKLGRNSPHAFYQYVRGAYTLGISASKGNGEELISVNIGAIDVPDISEKEYILKEPTSGNFFGKYNIGGGLILRSNTGEIPGQLLITKHDPENFIISGTFSFTVKDENGEEIEITDGRFDLNYTS